MRIIRAMRRHITFAGFNVKGQKKRLPESDSLCKGSITLI
jgi:hypothetical protein